MRRVEVRIPHIDLVPAVQTATSRVENVTQVTHHLKARPNDFSRPLLHRLVCSLMIPASTYVAAQRMRRVICDEFRKAFEKLDLMLAPTTPVAAYSIEESQHGSLMLNGREVALQTIHGSLGTSCTIPFNVTGLPAISLCSGFSSLGLPMGLQIIGDAFQESKVFQVAHTYEQAARWFETRPHVSDLSQP